MSLKKRVELSVGKVTIVTVLFMMTGMVLGFLLDLHYQGYFSTASANTATTSVTVLNTPPNWTVDAQEAVESSAANPTNSGTAVTFVATGTDDNNDAYYLLICKTGSAPTATSGGAPTCNGGISNQWTVSTSTVSGTQASAATTTTEAMVESNAWFAFICDANVSLPQCNATAKQGTGLTASPFVVNHRPTFTIFVDNSPKLPGAVVTWTSTSSDTDVLGTPDTVNLFVCKANDFTGTACGAGGTYCTSGLVAADPSCTFTLENPKPDRNYTAYGYVIDNHNHSASGGSEGTNSILTVANATPTITAASISLNDTDLVGQLTLTTIQGQTTGFSAKFTVADANSCIANSSTTPEIVSASANVYRSAITQAGCLTSGNYNTNNCYPAAIGTTTWNLVCTQDANSCQGEADSDATWTCTFPLWYNADPTDTGSQFPTQNWLVSVKASDKLFATSTLVEGSTGNKLTSFLAYSVATTSIAYGGLQPGQQNDPLNQQTDISAVGNVGLDQTLYGDAMCPTYPTCSGAATSTIPINQQKYATSSVSYATGVALSANPGALLNIAVPKTTATATPQTKNTFWGIHIPVAITLAGSYLGQNTFIGVTSSAAQW